MLDPACGSGHFLLGAYDLLECAYQHAGIAPAEAASHIIKSLWGIDIDLRCVQVASAALLLRARRSCPVGRLPRPNIICARSFPATAIGFDELMERLDPTQRTLLKALSRLLDRAPVLGPLLRVETEIKNAIRESIAGTPHGALAGAVDLEAHSETAQELLMELREVAASTTSTPTERLLVAEADDAVRFVMAMHRRYDAVLQNPPFGDPVHDTRPYLKAAYPWIPSRNHNLLAAFVGRGLELCKPGVGYVGAITARSGMFLKTFESWRKQIMLGYRLVTLADLGHGVMEQALVEAAAYVLKAEKTEPNHHATFIRLLKDTDRPAALSAAIRARRLNANDDDRVFRVALSDFKAVSGWPVAYWMGVALRSLFIAHPPLEGRGAEVRSGLSTGDDFRFVRAFWEIDPSRIGRNRDETKAGKSWVPFAKGGEYSPYWADIHLVVNWQNDGEVISAHKGSVPRNTRYYFYPGLTWTERTTSGFGPRVMRAGGIFSTSQGAIPLSNYGALLGYLNSRLCYALLAVSLSHADSTKSGGPAKRYSIGQLKQLPWIDKFGASFEMSKLAIEIANLRRRSDVYEESSRLFMTPPLVRYLLDGSDLTGAARDAADSAGRENMRMLELSYKLEKRIHAIAELDADAEAYLDSEVGPHPATYSTGPFDEDELTRFLTEPIKLVIGEIIKQRGGSRAVANLTYFADRRLEVIAHGLQRPPAQIEAFRREKRILPHGEPAASAANVLSYLVGLAFGRWDIRSAGLSEPDLGGLFDPVPIHPLGMLLDEGRPARTTPAGYELDLPPEQMLLDQPGHPWDVVGRVVTAAALLVEDADSLLDDLMSYLDGRDLRHHMRRHFFKAHLTRYSKSRRKAPIYWPLYTPSGAWGVWVYAPSLRRETLYAVEAVATARIQAARIEIDRQTRLLDSRVEQPKSKAAEILEIEQHLADELTVFQQKAERVAALGWEPDLDDGIVLCAAPLADLFVAWPEAAKYRKEIKAGKYPWASVSQWADEL